MSEVGEVYALTAIMASGEEGIIVVPMNGINVPMVCEEENIPMLREVGPQAAAGIKQTISMVKFVRALTEETFEPGIIEAELPEFDDGKISEADAAAMRTPVDTRITDPDIPEWDNVELDDEGHI